MTMITIIHEQRETQVPLAKASMEALWMDRASIKNATGWSWKPEGLCKDESCVPLPNSATTLVQGETLDIAQMWRYMGNPVVHDAAASTWVLGTGSVQRMDTLRSLEAPDFALPDLDGNTHRLSDYRGKKVFLATWASW